MVHKHSSQARHVRRLRALERGFIVAPKPETRWTPVCISGAQDLQSLDSAVLNSFAATCGEKGISCWADAVDQFNGIELDDDPLWLDDPWLQTDGCKQSAEPSSFGQDICARTLWENFQPSLTPCHSGTIHDVDTAGPCSSYMAHLEKLVASQNDTIAILTAKLDAACWAPSSAAIAPVGGADANELQILKAQVDGLSRSFASLSSSLGQAVESSLDMRLPPKFAEYASNDHVSLQFAEMRNLVEKVSASAVQDCVDATSALMQTVSTRCLETSVQAMRLVSDKLEKEQSLLLERLELLERPAQHTICPSGPDATMPAIASSSDVDAGDADAPSAAADNTALDQFWTDMWKCSESQIRNRIWTCFEEIAEEELFGDNIHLNSFASSIVIADL